MRGTTVTASSFVLAAVSVGAFVAFAALFRDHTASAATGPSDPFACEAASAWRASHGAGDDLRVVGVDIVFHAGPDGFVVGQGEVIVPLATDLPGAQEVLEVRADPPPSRVLHVDGTTVVAWDYAGAVHRDMHFVGVALVRRAPLAQAVVPAAPTFDALPESARDDARLRAQSLGDHSLQRCKAFAQWAQESAGPPPHTEQLIRLAQRVHAGIVPKETGKRKDDACAALRTGQFSEHYAQVLVVMALRELGAPAYGLQSAEAPHSLVATYVDGPGWLTLDIMAPERGLFSGGVAFVAKAPIVGEFAAARDGFWYPTGSAYRPSQGEARAFSWTTWNSLEKARTDDSTVTWERPLSGVCR